MREKQLAQEAKKLDAKVGGTGQRVRSGRGGGVELEPTGHPEGLSRHPKGWRGALGGDSQARLPYTIQDIFGLRLGQEPSLW